MLQCVHPYACSLQDARRKVRLARKTINYEYRQEVVTYIINVAILLVFVMIFLDGQSNLVLFPLTFLAYSVNSIFNIVFTIMNKSRNYGTTRGSKKVNLFKYIAALVITFVLFLISAIVLW